MEGSHYLPKKYTQRIVFFSVIKTLFFYDFKAMFKIKEHCAQYHCAQYTSNLKKDTTFKLV